VAIVHAVVAGPVVAHVDVARPPGLAPVSVVSVVIFLGGITTVDDNNRCSVGNRFNVTVILLNYSRQALGCLLNCYFCLYGCKKCLQIAFDLFFMYLTGSVHVVVLIM
jgi:hypothetical protein